MFKYPDKTYRYRLFLNLTYSCRESYNSVVKIYFRDNIYSLVSNFQTLNTFLFLH